MESEQTFTVMRYEPPPWDELKALALRAIEATGGETEVLTGSETDNITVGLAASKRCRRLMLALVALVDAGLPDVIGLNLRALYESWLVGVYGLLGGGKALLALTGQRAFHLRKIVAALGEETDEFDNGKNLPVAQMAELATQLLDERGHPNASFPSAAYQTLYRFESYNSTHGGLGSIVGYIDENEERRKFREERPHDDAGIRHRFLMGIALLVSIGQIAATDARLSTAELDEIAAYILELDPRRKS